MNIHRGKKLNIIAKKKDDIAKHLMSGNEVNAKIWVSRADESDGVLMTDVCVGGDTDQ
jgi:hypothetical protein